jgi:glyoxylase-like metal-dependent hydrolase (beta-lactamase superfamily II)
MLHGNTAATTRSILGESLRTASLRTTGLLLTGLALAGCSDGDGDNGTRQPDASPAADARQDVFEPVVHRYSAGAQGILVNAYLVETRNGVIAIDSTLTVSDSKALRQQLDDIGKPLLAVLITHGHPDHYNGITELVAGTDVPIVATAGVAQVIEQYDEAKEAQWTGVFGEEWPAVRTFPNQNVANGETLTFDGVGFTVTDLGAGESHADSYWVMDGKRAFIGDLVLYRMHAYVADGHTAEWLENLDRVEAALADVAVVYPGHGEPGGLDMIAWQRAYLEHYRTAVEELAAGQSTLTDDAKAELVQRMKTFLPTDALEFLIALGADAVAAELAEPAE